MDDQEPLIKRAELLMQTRRWSEAEKLLRQVIVNDPQSARARSMLAFTLLELKQPKEATRIAEEAITLEPDEPMVHYTLAVVLLQRNHLAEAVGAIEEAIQLNPFEPRFFGALANIRLDQRQWKDALDAADRGLELDPEHHWCLNARGMALTHLNDRQAAAKTIEGALERDPDNAFTHANRGWALLHENEPRKAMEHFREALRLNPGMDFARAGIVEAMKARNPLYRLLLMYFLFMARQSGRMQTFILIGGYVGYRVLVSLRNENPSLAPYVLPLIIAYVVFALSTWLAPALMDLLLRLDKFGRYALSKEQAWTSNLVGTLLGIAATMFVLSLFTADDWPRTAALFAGLLAIPCSAIFHCDYGWPRWAAIAIAVGLLLVASIEVTLQLLDSRPGYSYPSFPIFTLGILLSSFTINGLVSAKVRQ